MIKNNDMTAQLIESFADRMMDMYDLPGLSIGVLKGKDRFLTARGYRNYITKDPMEPDHIFHCASVSKLFTSAGIMKLVEDGEIALDDRLVDILPKSSISDRRCENVTIQQMLTHTSGLGDVEDYRWDTPRTDDGALRDYVMSDEVKDTPMLWEPGQGGFRYSNIAYEMLGLIVSEKTGMTFEDAMEKWFLRPSSMHDSTFLTFRRTGGSLDADQIDSTGNMAMPYSKAEDRSIVPEPYYPYNRMHGPSSTLTSNAGDLLKWAGRHMDREVFAPETYDIIWRSYAEVPNNGEGMGLGWFIRKQEGYTLYGHEGTDDGFRASFWICPEIKTAVTVLANISNAPVKKINKKLFAELVTRL